MKLVLNVGSVQREHIKRELDCRSAPLVVKEQPLLKLVQDTVHYVVNNEANNTVKVMAY